MLTSNKQPNPKISCVAICNHKNKRKQGQLAVNIQSEREWSDVECGRLQGKRMVLTSKIEFVSGTPWPKDGDLDLVILKKKSPAVSQA
jgi:hypothetical protein